MPIQEQNIKFLESQVMDDVPEGGGAATGREIADGVMNNVFEDVSDLDRAYGRFNLRKLFLAVRTLSTDLYGGAKTVVTALPTDPAVGYTLFTTKDAFDTRTQAANRVEAYLYKGPMWHGGLYENHISGMRAISVIQRVGTELPPIGKTLTLVHNEGTAGEIDQYVRVIDVDVTETTLTDDQGDYQRWIVRMDLSDALRHDFPGHAPNRYDDYDYETGARLRDTTVADATRYYAAQPLAEDASIGDLEIRADSIFSQLVPSAQTETPLVQQPLNPTVIQTIDAGSRDVEVSQQAHTLARDVTAENRRLNWIETIGPIPARGTFVLSFLAQGNWYTIQDDGAGSLTGTDPSIGAGTLDYDTGAMSVTLGALPDAGSQILMVWASPVHYVKRTGSGSDVSSWGAQVSKELPHQRVIPTSLTVSWTRNGTTKTATADGAGVIAHTDFARDGQLDPITGRVDLYFDAIPDRETTIVYDYQWLEADDPAFEPVTEIEHEVTNSISDVITTGEDLSGAAGSIRVYVPIIAGGLGRVLARDDGAGALVVESFIGRPPSRIAPPSSLIGAQIGTVDYSLGTITLESVSGISTWSYLAGEWVPASGTVYLSTRAEANPARVLYPTGAATTAATASANHELGTDGVVVDLTATVSSAVVPTSVELSVFGQTYQDRVNGTLVDGAGNVYGQMDYDLGHARLTWWDNGTNYSPSVTSCLTVYGDWTAGEAFFRTASAPIAPQSLQIVATTEDGEQITGTADSDGVIDATWIQGRVNYQFGTARVEFGARVLDSSLTDEEKDEPWYDPADVDGDGYIWQPRPVIPSATHYNAVAYAYIPLDSEILGIDAVRLPADGRVPIFRKGDVVLIMHPQDTAPQTVTDGDTIATRPRVAWVRLIDGNGDTITGGYSLDRATGTVTIDDASGMTNPVTVRHTVADLRLLTDVQISGDLTLSRPLTHDYPADETIVASCLLHGDRRARVSHTWDESTWDGTWQDSISGDPATATLNLIDYPITVTNEGCDTERWLLRCKNVSTDEWELIGENRGLVWTGTYAPGGDDIAPINPRTREFDDQTGTWVGGTPYLRIPGAANGGGWSTGNVIRINTVGAIADFWIARAIQQSDEPLDDGADGCEIYALGNIDRP